MQKIPITPSGFRAIDAELKQLKSEDRPNIIKAIAEARAHGDLSENAEYHAAKEKQGFIEARIQELEALYSRAEIIDPKTQSGNVKFGATVHLIDEDTEEKRVVKIVAAVEADISKGLLSTASPLAKAWMGKDIGDTAEVQTPKGERYYEIKKIEYI